MFRNDFAPQLRANKRKLIINLKMLINLITVFIFIALPVRH